LDDLACDREQSRGRLQSAPTFLAGASRTADRGPALAVGVHAAQELHVIILDEDDCPKEGS
jgi:L-lactate utilization protein LutC